MHQITVGEYRIDVVRKKIKNLHLGVYPPDGRIRVAAPLNVKDEAIRLHVLAKLGWIKKHIAEFQSQTRQSVREYISGESHYLEGNRFLLNVIPNASYNRIKIRNNTFIDLYVKPGTGLGKRRELMEEWYRSRLKARIEPLVHKWQARIGVEALEFKVKRMKTKWGSCNIKDKRIWINLELAKKPEQSLEYIVVHELLHLKETSHGSVFKELMDKLLPDWRLRKKELNKFPLSYEEWEEIYNEE